MLLPVQRSLADTLPEAGLRVNYWSGPLLPSPPPLPPGVEISPLRKSQPVRGGPTQCRRRKGKPASFSDFFWLCRDGQGGGAGGMGISRDPHGELRLYEGRGTEREQGKCRQRTERKQTESRQAASRSQSGKMSKK
jgi:hypothetical protein